MHSEIANGYTRRGAGVVDRAALEMRCTGNCTGGSNPSLSAKGKVPRKPLQFCRGFFVYASDLGVYSLSRLCRQKNSNRVRGTLLFARALAASNKGWASVARQSLSTKTVPFALANTFAEREGFACGNPTQAFTHPLNPPPLRGTYLGGDKNPHRALSFCNNGLQVKEK